MPTRAKTLNPLARVQRVTRRAMTITKAEHQRMYWGRWRRASRLYLVEHPFCTRCEETGRAVPAVVTDHVIPHKGEDRLFWNPDNWQALCKLCHDRKTATEDGGLGRACVVTGTQGGRLVEHASDEAWDEYVNTSSAGTVEAQPIPQPQSKAGSGLSGRSRARRTKAGRPRLETPNGGGGSNVQAALLTSHAPSQKSRARNWNRGGEIRQGGRSAVVDYWNRTP